MTRKEDIERVRQIVSGAEMDKREWVDDQKIAQANESANKFQKKKESEARLRATGVVDLFEKIKGEHVVEYRNGIPAIVEVDGGIVDLVFNCSPGYLHYGDICVDEHYIEAKLEHSELIISGREEMVVGIELSMADAVGKAIVDPKEHRGRYPR